MTAGKGAQQLQWSRPDGLAPFAAQAGDPGARRVPEPDAVGRTAFQRDRDRLIHCVAFRRLAGKTQVLAPAGTAHHRTRLTHTLEVAQVARSLARCLCLDEDLAEAVSLAHDFGHGPFGHTGEAALDEVLAPFGGFDHNVQSLRIVADLEQRYLSFDGLNLCWTTLEGLAKRKGPCFEPTRALRRYDEAYRFGLDRQPSAEAQVAAVADDIAYNAHDLEDGLLAGFFSLGDAAEVPVVAELLARLRRVHGPLDPARVPFALARGLIDLFVTDVLAETGRRLARARPASVEAVRGLPAPVVGLSPAMAEADAALKRFLFANLYHHPDLLALRRQAHGLVERLTRALLAEPARLPEPWAERAGKAPGAVALAVGDFVSGLTDAGAEAEHRRLF